MAEFRKREDITQEIDLLQQWSDLGAPRMGELAPNLKHLVKTVDPSMASKIEIRTAPAGPSEAPVPSEVPPKTREVPGRTAPGEDVGWPPEGPPPPEFADLPPGDEDRPSRSVVLPIVGAVLLLAAAAALWWSKDDAVRVEPPSPTPDQAGGAMLQPSAGGAGLPPTIEATVPATAAPTAAATAHAVRPTTAVAPTSGPTGPHAARTPLPGLKPVRPIVRTQPKVTEYVVRLGDSLSLIAKRELGDMERWPELAEMNQAAVANPDLILPGQHLSLPTDAGLGGAEVEYTTRPGDTLRDIAKAHLGDEGRWKEIWEMNGDKLPAQTVVPPGTVLRLPAAPGAGPKPAAKRPGWKGAGKMRHHVVKHGESLSLLARRYLGSTARWPEIYYLNRHKIAHAHWVYPGQVLAIPPAHGGRALRYVVRTGDTLWAIAATHMGSPFRWPSLYRANTERIANPHWIYPGQVFRVPR